MSYGLLTIVIADEGRAWCVKVEGEGLHTESVIRSPWFKDMPLQQFFSEFQLSFDVHPDECHLYYSPMFVELEADTRNVVVLSKVKEEEK